MHNVSQEEFGRFKERANNFVNNHLDSADELLRSALVKLNVLPDIATVFCCSGHEDTQRAGYMMFTTTNLDVLYKLYGNIVSLVEGDVERFRGMLGHQWRLSFVRRMDPERKWYNAIIIGFPTWRRVEFHCQVFEEAVDLLLRDFVIEYSDRLVSKNEVEVDGNYLVFEGSELGYVAEFHPKSLSGKDIVVCFRDRNEWRSYDEALLITVDRTTFDAVKKLIPEEDEADNLLRFRP